MPLPTIIIDRQWFHKFVESDLGLLKREQEIKHGQVNHIEKKKKCGPAGGTNEVNEMAKKKGKKHMCH